MIRKVHFSPSQKFHLYVLSFIPALKMSTARELVFKFLSLFTLHRSYYFLAYVSNSSRHKFYIIVQTLATSCLIRLLFALKYVFSEDYSSLKEYEPYYSLIFVSPGKKNQNLLFALFLFCLYIEIVSLVYIIHFKLATSYGSILEQICGWFRSMERTEYTFLHCMQDYVFDHKDGRKRKKFIASFRVSWNRFFIKLDAEQFCTALKVREGLLFSVFILLFFIGLIVFATFVMTLFYESDFEFVSFRTLRCLLDIIIGLVLGGITLWSALMSFNFFVLYMKTLTLPYERQYRSLCLENAIRNSNPARVYRTLFDSQSMFAFNLKNYQQIDNKLISTTLTCMMSTIFVGCVIPILRMILYGMSHSMIVLIIAANFGNLFFITMTGEYLTRSSLVLYKIAKQYFKCHLNVVAVCGSTRRFLPIRELIKSSFFVETLLPKARWWFSFGTISKINHRFWFKTITAQTTVIMIVLPLMKSTN